MPKSEPKERAKSKKAHSLRLTLRRSLIGKNPKLKRVLLGMGLTRINRSIVLPDNPSTRGMIDIVGSMIEVQEVKGA